MGGGWRPFCRFLPSSASVRFSFDLFFSVVFVLRRLVAIRVRLNEHDAFCVALHWCHKRGREKTDFALPSPLLE